MPVLRWLRSSHRTSIVIGLFCVCIVTVVGVVRASKGSNLGVAGGRILSIEMGHISTNDQLDAASDLLRKSNSWKSDPQVDNHLNLVDIGNMNSFKELPLPRTGNGRINEVNQKLNNPHPHISLPQLPFCKPTKTTVGSSGTPSGDSKKPTESGKKDSEDSSRYHDSHYDDDIEVINTAEGVVDTETDRKFLVATLDGRVTLLNKTGDQLWSVKTGHLFSSTISSHQLSENGKRINLIPSLTGGVYKYDGDSLHPMPFNADSLLKKSFKLSNDVVITGGKELRTYGIDIKSGTLRYECGISGCVVPGDSEVNAGGTGTEDSVVLVIKKQLQTVRAIDSLSGAERWNFSVGTHEMALAGVTEGCYHAEQKDDFKRASDYIKIVIPEGRVFGADRENRVMWDQQFEAPISQAWILEDGQLVSVDPITNTPLKDVPSLYIGIHDQQLYVQESQSIAGKMEKYFGLDDKASLKQKHLNVVWKPTVAIDKDSGQTALSTVSPTINWVSIPPSSNFRPIYVYERDSIGDSLEDINDTKSEDGSDDSDEDLDEELQDLNFGEGITQVIVMSLWFWWKEVLGISLLTAVLLNLILMKPIMRAVRSQTIREMSGYFQQLWNRWKEEEESRALLARHSSNLLSLPAPEDEVNEESRKRSTSSSSAASGGPGSPSDDRDIYFSSQYLNEFIPIECLGRGGFGVVFEAKKKIDERTYAVKRITLPDREKARVRVMREVKALAQLDHRHVVRYFNAWIESPPPGWLEKNDPLWAKTLISSPNPTVDYTSDMLGSSILPNLQRGKSKPDHSKISVPNTPGEEVNDDSYIVFESSATSTSSKTSYVLKESLVSKSIEYQQQRETSIGISISDESSVTSSVSGGGFFARRPTSLSIHSRLSSFHDNDEMSHHDRSITNYEFSERKESEKEDKIDDIIDDDVYNVMYLYIQQELCQKRTLQEWLRSERNRDLFLIIKLFSQIVEAVEYVHSKKLIHRDLKPSNIFLAEITENGIEVLTVKIGDFGLATTAYAEMETEKVTATPLEDKSLGQASRINLTGHVGTHLYMSPEQYHRKPYDYKVDIYSLGLIFFEFLVPFATDMERYNTLSGVRKVNFPDNFKDNYPNEHDLIRTMISHNPNERPDAAKINTWLKQRILSIDNKDNSTSHEPQGFVDSPFLVGRSVSSPAEIVVGSKESPPVEKKKLKPRFYKTQSVM